MSWHQAELSIITNIVTGIHLDPSCSYRYVLDSPPYPCSRNGFYGAPGFLVSVGARSTIEIPMILLRDIYYASRFLNGRHFCTQLFRQRYLRLYNQKPCFVNSVGKIFVVSGIAVQAGTSSYLII